MEEIKQYAEMKDSGVEWIGKIPKKWNLKKLKYFCTERIESKYYNKETDIYIGLENVSSLCNCITKTDSEHDEKIYNFCHSGDVLFCKLRPYLAKCIIAPFNACCTGEFLILKSKSSNNFLRYWLLNNGFLEKVNSLTYGAKMPRANTQFILNLPIVDISTSEQQAIATYLDNKCAAIDDIINSTRESIEDYKQLKASTIYEAVTKGLDPNIEMKDSGVEWIGEIPKAWKITTLKHFYDFDNGPAVKVGPFGSALKSKDIVDKGKWVYNQRIVLDNNFCANNTCITDEKFNELHSFRVCQGDILITTRGTIGKIAVVPYGAPEGIIHPCLIRFRVKDAIYRHRLLEYIFNYSYFVQEQIYCSSNSTTLEVIYSYTLKEILLPVIPLVEQDIILSYLDTKCAEIDSLIAEKEALIADLEAYKKSLIYECVTGKRRVTDDIPGA